MYDRYDSFATPAIPTPTLCSAMRPESDARYGSFDFRAAHDEAASDLQALLDNNESLVRKDRFHREWV